MSNPIKDTHILSEDAHKYESSNVLSIQLCF